MTFYILFLLTTLWFIFMTWLSHQNGSDTAETSRHLAEGLSAIFHSRDLHQLNGTLRRTAHIVVFAVLTVLVLLTIQTMLTMQTMQTTQTMQTMQAGKIEGRWIAVCLISVWAWLDEATKPLVQGRHFSWPDVGLNLVGVGIGSLIGNVVTALRK